MGAWELITILLTLLPELWQTFFKFLIKNLRDFPTDSKDVMNDHFNAWFAVFTIIHWGIFILFGIGKFILTRKAELKENWYPRLKIASYIYWYIFTIPAGVNYSKVFWCLPKSNLMDVSNELVCWDDTQSKLYFSVAFLSLAVHFIAIPIYYSICIRKEKFEK